LFGEGVVVWGRPLGGYSHEIAEARAKEIALLAQFVFWGKVYEFGHGAIAQTHLSIPSYRDFRADKLELWKVDIQGPLGRLEFTADIPQRRYSFEPIVLTSEVISRYSRPGALLIYSKADGGEVVGSVGDEFTAIEHRHVVSRVRSGEITGWVRLPALSIRSPEVVDFVGGIIRVFRGDWSGVELLMNSVVENRQAPNEIRTDAWLYKGMAAARQGHSSVGAFNAARELSPTAKRCIVYTVMGMLTDYRAMQASKVRTEDRRELLESISRLLDSNRYLFSPEDPWFLTVSEGIRTLAGS
jgi:hypothetical protein